MPIIDAILHANNAVEIYELLNVYIDAVHLAEHTDSAAPYPLESAKDVMQEMRTLFIGLGLVSRRLKDDSRIVIKEALCVFNAALDRLRALAEARDHRDPIQDARREPADPVYFAEHGRRRLDRDSRCLLA